MKSTVFYGKACFQKTALFSVSGATWINPLSLKSVLILSFQTHVGHLHTLYSSSFRTTLIHPLLHTYHMPCTFYPHCPSPPKIIRWRVQIKNLLNMQFHLSEAKISSSVFCTRIRSAYFRFLTHWGRVTQICVFTLQLCKTDDANLRF